MFAKFIFFFAALFSAFFLPATHVELSGHFSESAVRQIFVSREGELRDAIVQLLKLDGMYEEGDSLQNAVSKTQGSWIAVRQGRGGKERADLVDKDSSSTDQVITIAKEMGLFDAKLPTLSHYDYALWLGALLDGARFRIAELVKAWQAGVHFDTLVVLTGERDLRQDLEGIERLCDPSTSPLPFKDRWKLSEGARYQTECDMMRIVWEQVQLPEDMAKALEGKVIFVNTKKTNGLRPSTKDTYVHWLKEYQPRPGTVLAISSPGLWMYQQLVGENMLGHAFFLDTIAPATSSQYFITQRHALTSIVHDTIAKCLYEVYTGAFKKSHSYGI